ncbi:MAG: SMC-Scp complex subunit ScpB, partial [Patescibacteria group bacterium]
IIDEVRGVDCTNTLKNLLLKGLVDRKEDPKDHRTHIYYLHSNTLKHLGINHKNELPQFSEIKEQLEKRFVFNKDNSEESSSVEAVASEQKDEPKTDQDVVVDKVKTESESASS